MIPESAVIVQYAIEANKDKGIELIPADPLDAARMRIKMEQFSSKYLMPCIRIAYLALNRTEGNQKDIEDFINAL